MHILCVQCSCVCARVCEWIYVCIGNYVCVYLCDVFKVAFVHDNIVYIIISTYYQLEINSLFVLFILSECPPDCKRCTLRYLCSPAGCYPGYGLHEGRRCLGSHNKVIIIITRFVCVDKRSLVFQRSSRVSSQIL